MGFDFLDFGFPKSGTDWKSLNGKPYITVSSKGRSNGLSDKINDGADFGPDTMQAATSPSQTGSSYSKSLGFQETLDYARANNIHKIVAIGNFVLDTNFGNLWSGNNLTMMRFDMTASGQSADLNNLEIDLSGAYFTITSALQEQLQNTNENFFMFYSIGTSNTISNIHIHGGRIDGGNFISSTPYYIRCVGITGASGLEVNDMSFTNFISNGNFIWIFGMNGVDVHDNYMLNTAGDVVDYDFVNGGSFHDNVILGFGGYNNNSQSGPAINIANNSSNVGIYNNVMISVYGESPNYFGNAAITLLLNSGESQSNIVMEGNITDTTLLKIYGNNTSPYPTINNLSITNNFVYTELPVEYVFIYPVYSMTLTNLLIESNNALISNIISSIYSSAIQIQSVNYGIIKNNTIIGNNAIPIANGIQYLTSSNLVIEGNYFNFNVTYFLTDGSITSPSTNVIVRNNYTPNGTVYYGNTKFLLTEDNFTPLGIKLTLSNVQISTPAVPASGTAQQNTYPYPVNVYLYGGTVTEIQLTRNGTAYTVFSNATGLALSGQVYKLNPSDSITVTYTSAPTWEWLSD